ncbi:hypothetical protein A3A75_02005 [Candidatus Woesebacteria bacterium RIFCSPLOWO2_01_FULL_39_10]|uniref:Elongation factor Ts n=1 Tax=Candidatus Woesebacteria bacterium RIFCSPLOWO2_01_FULL_39_10 TaxID=1802516 RepID=A0A1F8BAP7_9BACT|nr:MAG: hypothetical protein A3A75_02005 [Candidatus Woesebacteria bacterium RIFCSPLOWO2_01_FULL_39_10]
MKISTDLIRKLRKETGAPVMRVKKVLEMFGDLPAQAGEKKAKELLRNEGFEKAAKRSMRATSQGLLETYVHHSGKVASVVELLCETDFVARNEIFKELAHNLALQAASQGVKDAKELENQEFIKDPSQKVSDLVKDVIAKTGENIRIGRIWRIVLGE